MAAVKFILCAGHKVLSFIMAYIKGYQKAVNLVSLFLRAGHQLYSCGNELEASAIMVEQQWHCMRI
jgi:hypothetical protein